MFSTVFDCFRLFSTVFRLILVCFDAQAADPPADVGADEPLRADFGGDHLLLCFHVPGD